MVVDHEAAWIELQQLVASKTQHGRESLLTSMAEIAARNRVPSGEVSRLLRLYGVEVERARSITAETDRDSGESPGGGLVSSLDAIRPGHHDRGGHDGGSIGSNGSAVRSGA